MKKIQTVLVPIDFSPISSTAFQYALNLADVFEAALHIVHVRTFSASIPEFTMVPMVAIAPDFAKEQMDIFMNQAAKDRSLLKLDYVQVTNEIRGGSLATEILRYAEDDEAQLIVIGTVGAEDFVDKLTGSVAWEIIYRACCPVFVIPSGVVYKPIYSIVYATNEESASPKLIHELEYLNKFLSAQIHFIYMDNSVSNAGEGGRLETIHHLSENLHSISSPGAAAEIEVLQKNNSFKAVSEYIGSRDIDLLIFATRRRSYWSRLFGENLTERLASHINLPVLFLHKNDRE